MPTARSSVSIEASQDDAFAFIRDVRNVPSFVARITTAEPLGDETARVTAGTTTSDVEFRVHETRRHRVEWGVPGADYHGWLEVDREGQVCSVTAEVHAAGLKTEDLDQALWALKDAIERQYPASGSGSSSS